MTVVESVLDLLRRRIIRHGHERNNRPALDSDSIEHAKHFRCIAAVPRCDRNDRDVDSTGMLVDAYEALYVIAGAARG